jgi:hypothetical protein
MYITEPFGRIQQKTINSLGNPSRWSGKVLMLVVLFWGFVIFCSYNAILTSVLSVAKVSSSVNSLEDLLVSTRFTPIFKNDFHKKTIQIILDVQSYIVVALVAL